MQLPYSLIQTQVVKMSAAFLKVLSRCLLKRALFHVKKLRLFLKESAHKMLVKWQLYFKPDHKNKHILKQMLTIDDSALLVILFFLYKKKLLKNIDKKKSWELHF